MTHHSVNTGNPSSPAGGDAVGGSSNSEVPMAEKVATPGGTVAGEASQEASRPLELLLKEQEVFAGLDSELERPVCNCGNEAEWRVCYNCEDGLSDHDCGEDCCCCLDPEPNVECDICDGAAGWFQCAICHPWED